MFVNSFIEIHEHIVRFFLAAGDTKRASSKIIAGGFCGVMVAKYLGLNMCH